MKGKRRKSRRGTNLPKPAREDLVAEEGPERVLSITCIDLPGRRKALVDGPTDSCMQENISGTLGFGPEIGGYRYLSLSSGSATSVVLLPHGSSVIAVDESEVAVTVFGVELVMGDRISAGGGSVFLSEEPLPPGVDLTGEAFIEALQSLTHGERELTFLDLDPS